ncbi:hypothetical protein HQ585_14730 [candidate division KSB1 bacterium]|nr:hypothetical protein [candidate division KSB1 bacterium]
MRKWILLSLSLFIILMACTQKEKQPALAEGEIFFNVDSTLIQTPFSVPEYGFQVSPPITWLATSPNMLKQIKESLESVVQPKGDFQINPLQFFLHPDHPSVLVVSYITDQNVEADIPALQERYITSIRTSLALYNLQENQYTKTGIPIIQYLLQKDGNIIFKILFEDSKNQLIQLDYVVPQSVFPEESKAIESSIGTISIQ